MTGLLVAALAGVVYLLSLRFVARPETWVAILLIGRALLGVAESFIITGALSWGLALMGPQNTGKVMAWVRTALYAVFAVGAPAGTVLYAGDGFAAIALATMVLPVASSLLVVPLRPVAPSSDVRPAFTKVVGLVWLPGLGLALSGVGFGAITTFIALLFADRGWSPACLAFTASRIAFIVGRLFFGHLPDRIGGAKVALVCVLIETVGQGADLAGAWVRAGVDRGHAHRPRLLARVSRLWRGSAPRRARGEPGPRHGRVHRLSRLGAGARRASVGSDRGQGRPRVGISGQHARGAELRGQRHVAPIRAFAHQMATSLCWLERWRPRRL